MEPMLNAVLHRDVSRLVEGCAQDLYPHVKAYMMKSDLYMPDILKTSNEIVDIYVDRLVNEVTTGYFYAEDTWLILPDLITRIRGMLDLFEHQSCFNWSHEAPLLITALRSDHIDLTNIKGLIDWVEDEDE